MTKNRKHIRDVFILIRNIRKEKDTQFKNIMKGALIGLVGDLSINNHITIYQYQKLDRLTLIMG